MIRKWWIENLAMASTLQRVLFCGFFALFFFLLFFFGLIFALFLSCRIFSENVTCCNSGLTLIGLFDPRCVRKYPVGGAPIEGQTNGPLSIRIGLVLIRVWASGSIRRQQFFKLTVHGFGWGDRNCQALWASNNPNSSKHFWVISDRIGELILVLIWVPWWVYNAHFMWNKKKLQHYSFINELSSKRPKLDPIHKTTLIR